MNGTAQISDCEQYRYTLTREWDHSGETEKAVFVMLNPSTADASEDDPTIRRCIGFAKAWNHSGLIVANLYALRSTSPANLWTHDDAIGPDNDAVLTNLALRSETICCAWGANAKPDRVRHFLSLMQATNAFLYCLGTTKAGAPRHPLYLRKDASLMQWPLSRED